VVIPLDIDSGDHMLKICWAGSCPISTTLHVNPPVASGLAHGPPAWVA